MLRMALAAWALSALFAGAGAQTIAAARYTDPTDRYTHGILGDAIEHGTLELTLSNGAIRRIILPPTRVFEDTAPRVTDLDGDGAPEVITVESSLTGGARLAIYGPDGLIADTPDYGRPFRWLAPLGAADLDGDGRIEIAYVDRPHLARTLRVWRFGNGTLTPVAYLPGLTNHRIGEPDIAGGIRDCGDGPEMITADADWRNIMATRLANGSLATRPVARHKDRASFRAALSCKDEILR